MHIDHRSRLLPVLTAVTLWGSALALPGFSTSAQCAEALSFGESRPGGFGPVKMDQTYAAFQVMASAQERKGKPYMGNRHAIVREVVRNMSSLLKPNVIPPQRVVEGNALLLTFDHVPTAGGKKEVKQNTPVLSKPGLEGASMPTLTFQPDVAYLAYSVQLTNRTYELLYSVSYAYHDHVCIRIKMTTGKDRVGGEILVKDIPGVVRAFLKGMKTRDIPTSEDAGNAEFTVMGKFKVREHDGPVQHFTIAYAAQDRSLLVLVRLEDDRKLGFSHVLVSGRWFDLVEKARANEKELEKQKKERQEREIQLRDAKNAEYGNGWQEFERQIGLIKSGIDDSAKRYAASLEAVRAIDLLTRESPVPHKNRICRLLSLCDQEPSEKMRGAIVKKCVKAITASAPTFTKSPSFMKRDSRKDTDKAMAKLFASLVAAHRDGDEKARSKAYDLLAQELPEAGYSLWEEYMRRDLSAAVRTDIAYLLRDSHDRRSILPLLSLLEKSDIEQVRFAARVGLASHIGKALRVSERVTLTKEDRANLVEHVKRELGQGNE